MGHLEDVNMGYFKHLLHASKAACLLCVANVVLLIHAVFPFFFEKTASTILRSVLKTSRPHGSRILVRFNTKWKDDPQQRKWRVLVDGVEGLTDQVTIHTEVVTLEEPVDGVQKFHFLCYGKVIGDGKGNVEIR